MAGILTLDTERFETEEQVIREYLLDVIREYGGTFTRHGQLPDIQGGKLCFTPGDVPVENVVAAEKPRLEELREQGLIDAWYIEEPPESVAIDRGSDPQQFVRQLNELSAEFIGRIFKEFEEVPAPIDEFPEYEASGPPVGQYMLIHFLMNKHGYDSFEEADMYITLINGCLHNIARGFGMEEMQEKTAEIVSNIEEMPAQIEEFQERMAGQQKFEIELDRNNEYPE